MFSTISKNTNKNCAKMLMRNNNNNNNKMDECDSRYTKSAQIATRTTSVNICVIKRSNVHSQLSP